MINPRRENLQNIYTESAYLARQALEAFQGLDSKGDAARAGRDFRRATHCWEEAEHAMTDAFKHRKRELEVRQQEFEMYNHLDNEYTSTDNFNAIHYCKRRLKRLKLVSDTMHIKSCLSHLEDKHCKITENLRMDEKTLITDDLRGKAKGFKGQRNETLDYGWGDQQKGWSTQRPQIRNEGDFHARRLNFFEKKVERAKRDCAQTAEETRRWELEWQQLVEDQRAFDVECHKLDDAARRHHERLPPRPSVVEVKEAGLKTTKPIARQDYQKRDQSKLQQETSVNMAGLGEHEQPKDMEAADEWETEYGAALEENPDFIAHSYPTRTAIPVDEEMVTADGITEETAPAHLPIVDVNTVHKDQDDSWGIRQELTPNIISWGVPHSPDKADRSKADNGWGASLDTVLDNRKEEHGWDAIEEDASAWELAYCAAAEMSDENPNVEEDINLR